jgi:general secretion pathway protein M
VKAQFVQAWRARAPRERLVLAGGTALLAFALVYAYAWLPMQRELAQLRGALPQLRVQAEQLQRDAEEVARLRARPAVSPASGSITALVEQRAAASGLREHIETITPQDAGRVRVVLPSVGFDAWLAWIGELRAAHGVRVESARIESSGEAGMVRVDAVLAGGA